MQATAICAKSCNWFAGTECSKKAELHTALKTEVCSVKRSWVHTRGQTGLTVSGTCKDAKQAISLTAA